MEESACNERSDFATQRTRTNSTRRSRPRARGATSVARSRGCRAQMSAQRRRSNIARRQMSATVETFASRRTSELPERRRRTIVRRPLGRRRQLGRQERTLGFVARTDGMRSRLLQRWSQIVSSIIVRPHRDRSCATVNDGVVYAGSGVIVMSATTEDGVPEHGRGRQQTHHGALHESQQSESESTTRLISPYDRAGQVGRAALPARTARNGPPAVPA